MNDRRFMIAAMRFATCAMLPLLVVACSDVQESRYADRAEVAANGAIERGWIPDWLPPEAQDIRESHDLDSNRLMVRFRVTPDIPLPLPATCRGALPQALPKPLSKPDWWPDDVPAPENAKTSHDYAACADGYVAFSASSGEGFFWR